MATEIKELCQQCQKRPIHIKSRKLCIACYQRMHRRGELYSCGPIQTRFIKIIRETELLIQEIDWKIKNNTFVVPTDHESASILLQMARYCLFLHNRRGMIGSRELNLQLLNIVLDGITDENTVVQNNTQETATADTRA